MLEKIMKEKVELLRIALEPVIYEHSLSDNDKFNVIIKLINKIILNED